MGLLSSLLIIIAASVGEELTGSSLAGTSRLVGGAPRLPRFVIKVWINKDFCLRTDIVIVVHMLHFERC